MTFKLPDLPYAYDALEPSIDARTMEIHHTKHHQTYVTNVNNAIEGKQDLQNRSIEDLCRNVNSLPADVKTAVRNNGGGHYNHSLFWQVMAPKGQGGNPSSELQQAIDRDLGGLEKMKEAFNNAAKTRFGSGWAWVIVTNEGKQDLQNRSIEDLCRNVNSLPADVKTAVRNNGGGHYNHSLFWQVMAPKGQGGNPSSELQQAIDRDLGGLEKMKETFNNAAKTRFGSGWAWVIVTNDGKLKVTSTPNQDNPLMTGIADDIGTPILGLDVWEHAYYLKYQNKRPDYVGAFWDVVNWNKVNENFSQAKK